jgi:hypothetical protein
MHFSVKADPRFFAALRMTLYQGTRCHPERREESLHFKTDSLRPRTSCDSFVSLLSSCNDKDDRSRAPKSGSRAALECDVSELSGESRDLALNDLACKRGTLRGVPKMLERLSLPPTPI